MSAETSQEFWLNSGFHLLDKDETGKLIVTDDFLRAYFLRPEVRPIEGSTEEELRLHSALMQSPRMEVSSQRLDVIEDSDVRDNYRVLLEFRARLLGSDNLESCYSEIFKGGDVSVPPLLIDQMVHVILRSVLDGCADPLQLRAAELFFRKQRVSIEGGAVFLADFDLIESHASGGSLGNIGRLIAEAQTPLKSLSLDVLEAGNALQYWGRDQSHDFVLRINHGTPAAKGICTVIERWILHFCNIAVTVRSIAAIEEKHWAWHIGLDAEATNLLNDLWRGVEVDHGRLERLLCLFRLEFNDLSQMREDVAGQPVYLALCMDSDGAVRVKPQNLLVNLPILSRQ